MRGGRQSGCRNFGKLTNRLRQFAYRDKQSYYSCCAGDAFCGYMKAAPLNDGRAPTRATGRFSRDQPADEDVAAEPVADREPVESVALDEDEQDQAANTVPEFHASTRNLDNAIVGVAAIVLLGIMSICGWVGFKALTPGPEAASPRSAPVTMAINRNSPPPKAETTLVESKLCDKPPRLHTWWSER